MLTSILVLSTIVICNAANILIVIPFTSTSHYILLSPVGLELARRGHNVTVITAHREKDPPEGYYQIMAEDLKIWEVKEGGRPNVFETVDYPFPKFQSEILWLGGLWTTENALNSSEVKEFMKKDNKFDLVISELFYQEALMMFAHMYQAPLAVITTYGNSVRNNYILRNPTQLSTTYHEFARIEEPFSFFGRLEAFSIYFYEMFWFKYWYLPKQSALIEKYFKNLPQPVPDLVEIQANVSLVLMNSHFSVDINTAYMPNMIEIGGVHLKKSEKELPQDLKKLMDEANEGVVYMSFGSNVKSVELPNEKRDAFLNVFAKLKQKVLWKWEDTNLTRRTANVIIREWMPQKEILSHPNVKVFISHGGLIGLQEAIFMGVPILGIPIYCDQYNNIYEAQEEGHAILLEYHDLNEQTLEDNLYKLLKNNSYKEKAILVSKRFKDRPISPLDTAIFWLEYIIRHKGADFMKNPALKMSFFSFYMIDVYLFILACIVSIITFVYLILRKISMKRCNVKVKVT